MWFNQRRQGNVSQPLGIIKEMNNEDGGGGMYGGNMGGSMENVM
jgi:hypothetical protein